MVLTQVFLESSSLKTSAHRAHLTNRKAQMTLFLKDLIERAVKTFAQAALSGFVVAASGIVDFGSGEA